MKKTKDIKQQIEKILSKKELTLVRRLNTPIKIQDYVDNIRFNFEEKQETYHSPRNVIKENVMHCLEGALFATLCLTYHQFENKLIDMKVKNLKKDSDHVICIFKQNNFWGAISKTNHSVLRFRDPIYKTERELVMSYYHEYFLETGEKTLKSFSKSFDVFKYFSTDWIVSEEDLDEIAEKIDKYPHTDFVPNANIKNIRKAGKTEILGAGIPQFRQK